MHDRTELVTQVITESTIVPRLPCCFGYAVDNIGDEDCLVNGRRLLKRPAAGLSGEKKSFVDPLRKELTENFQISFSGGGVAPAVEITQCVNLSA